MEDVSALLARWHLTPADAREQIYRAKTARERERWHALWSLSRGGPAAQVAQALERDPHTIGDWLTAFAQDGPPALACEQSGGSPRPPARAANRDSKPLWKARPPRLASRSPIGRGPGVQQFLRDHGGLELSRTSCLRWLHRLGFTWKRPRETPTQSLSIETRGVRAGVCATDRSQHPIRGEALVRR
jgi:transposase